MKKIKIITFVIWFFLVIFWNYGYPLASPFLDVLVALLLAVAQIIFLKFFIKK